MRYARSRHGSRPHAGLLAATRGNGRAECLRYLGPPIVALSGDVVTYLTRACSLAALARACSSLIAEALPRVTRRWREPILY